VPVLASKALKTRPACLVVKMGEHYCDKKHFLSNALEFRQASMLTELREL